MYQFNQGEKSIDENLLQRGLRNDSYRYIILMLLFSLAMYGMILLSTDDEDLDIRMDKNQVDIFTPDSQYGAERLTKGAIPIGAMAIFDETKSYSEKIDILKNAIQNAETMPINYGLNVRSNKFFDISERELYIVEETQYIDLKEESVEEEIAEKLARAKLKNKTVECTYVTCVLNRDVTFKQFLNSKQIKNLMDGNYYITSDTIIRIYTDLMKLINLESTLTFLGGSNLILVLIDGICFIVMMQRNRKVLVVYKDVGINHTIVRNEIKKKYICKMLYGMMIVIGGITTGVYALGNNKTFDWYQFLNVGILCVAICLEIAVRKNYINYFLDRLYRWDKRW